MEFLAILCLRPSILTIEKNAPVAVLHKPRLCCKREAASMKAYTMEISLSRRSSPHSDFLNMLRGSHSHGEPEQHNAFPRMG